MTILERIKLNSAKHPERVVMRTQYGFGEMTMKWGELDAFSDKLAYYLTKELRTNKPIIVYGHKHPMILVCFLACVKSGRAYCPIDEDEYKKALQLLALAAQQKDYEQRKVG